MSNKIELPQTYKVKVKFNANATVILQKNRDKFNSDVDDKKFLFYPDLSLTKFYEMGTIAELTHDEYNEVKDRTCYVNNQLLGNLLAKKEEFESDSRAYKAMGAKIDEATLNDTLFTQCTFKRPICEIVE